MKWGCNNHLPLRCFQFDLYESLPHILKNLKWKQLCLRGLSQFQKLGTFIVWGTRLQWNSYIKEGTWKLFRLLELQNAMNCLIAWDPTSNTIGQHTAHIDMNFDCEGRLHGRSLCRWIFWRAWWMVMLFTRRYRNAMQKWLPKWIDDINTCIVGARVT